MEGNSDQDKANAAYQPDNDASDDVFDAYRTPREPSPISWTASEFVAHQKESSWYLILGVGTAAIAFIIWLITRDIFSIAAVLVFAGCIGYLAARQPETQSYAVSHDGIQIGQKHFTYDTFKSFSIIHEGAVGYISLMPLKRFMPPMAIYYDPKDEDRIIDVLGSYLPHEERQIEFVDRIARKIRF